MAQHAASESRDKARCKWVQHAVSQEKEARDPIKGRWKKVSTNGTRPKNSEKKTKNGTIKPLPGGGNGKNTET